MTTVAVLPENKLAATLNNFFLEMLACAQLNLHILITLSIDMKNAQ